MKPRRPGSLILAGVIVLTLVAAAGIPAAADLDLIGGDSAQVAYTDGDGVNVRGEPGIDAAIVTALSESHAVAIQDGPLTLDDGSSWYLISTQNNEREIDGWVSADYLTGVVDVANAMGGAAAGALMIVSADGEGLNLRAGVGLGSEIIDAMPEGKSLEVLADAGVDADGIAWSEVRYGDTHGYAATEYLIDQPEARSAQLSGATVNVDRGDAIVTAALEYLWTPYLWGGSTPEGFDCSGFTYYILNEVLGYDFPRPMEDQVVSGSYVAMEDLSPGDLIFFENTYREGLSHVGFYVGDRQFVSATAQFNAVGISSLDNPYWGSRYVTARSIV